MNQVDLHIEGPDRRSQFLSYAIPALGLVCLCLLASRPSAALAQPSSSGLLVDDFESDTVGSIPGRWWGLDGRKVIPLSKGMQEGGEYYAVHEEGDNRFLRVRTKDESLRLVMPNEKTFDWSLDTDPILAWKWRLLQAPPGAREDRANDTAGAVYVTFSFDLLRRPRSIKYTYSSTLPVGTVVDQGRLQIIVVSSGLGEQGQWSDIRRNVVNDYVRVFGKQPPSSPVSIAIWSDSDTTHSISEIDFDDIWLTKKP